MRLLLALGLTFAALITPVSAYAETITYDEATDTGIPKGVVGYDGVRCTGESTIGDVTYRNTIYIGADAGEMAANPKREQAWQEDHCRYMEALQHGWFWQKRGLTFDPGSLKLTVTGV